MEVKKYILLTGATSGIGENLAIRLSAKYSLIINGRNIEKLASTLGLLNNQFQHIQWLHDLNDISNLENSLKHCLDSSKVTISAVIHCAGYLKMLPLKSISQKHLEETMNVNFNSAALIVKTLLNKKINSSSLSNIIFISSTASIAGAKAHNIYSASKGALDSLMRSLAVELAPSIRINSILPGGIRTKMTEHIYNNALLIEKIKKDYPLGLGEPDDIFEMADFLLSEKSKWITGQQFVVDGGRTINISG